MKFSCAKTLFLTSAVFVTAVSSYSTYSFDSRDLEVADYLQERDLHPFDLEERDFYDDALEARGFPDDELEARDMYFAMIAGRSVQERLLESRSFYDDSDAALLSRADKFELVEREYHQLEERNPISLAINIAKGIMKIVDLIKGVIEKDKERRSKFTPVLVQEIVKKYPKYNVVVCHTKHETKFDGQRGKDWGHMHQEFNVSFKKTIGYEIYWFKSGTFIRIGDGGYLNWAYQGVVAKSEDGGKRITFRAP